MKKKKTNNKKLGVKSLLKSVKIEKFEKQFDRLLTSELGEREIEKEL